MKENKFKVNLLKDFYESLLTEKQNEVLSMYYEEDLSLQEIADDLGISKAAVNDVLKRSLSQLNYYEDKLELLKKYEFRSIIYENILNKISDNDVKELIIKLKESE